MKKGGFLKNFGQLWLIEGEGLASRRLDDIGRDFVGIGSALDLNLTILVNSETLNAYFNSFLHFLVNYLVELPNILKSAMLSSQQASYLLLSWLGCFTTEYSHSTPVIINIHDFSPWQSSLSTAVINKNLKPTEQTWQNAIPTLKFNKVWST